MTSKDNPQKKKKAGWFVEIPAELKEQFRRVYPRRAQMRKITIIAIQYALRRRPPL